MKNSETQQTKTNEVIAELQASHDEQRIHELAQVRSIEVQRHVLLNPAASSKTLDMVAKKAPEFDDKFLGVARHKNTSGETLEWVYKRSQGKGLIHAVSRWFNPVTESAKEIVRIALAENVNTPLEILRKFTEDNSEEVRLSLTKNITIPNSVVGELAQDVSPKVRLSLAQNVNIPKKTRESILTRLLDTNDCDIKLQVIDNKELPESVRDVALTELCFDKNKKCWNELASSHNLSLDAVKSLMTEGDIEVKRTLFGNQHLPATAYSVLASEPDFHLLELLGDNPGVPQEVLEDMAKTSIEALKEMERLKQYTLVAIAVATNPSTPKSALDAFADMSPADKTDGALPGVDAGEEEELMDRSIPSQLRYLALHNPSYKN